MTRYIDIRKNTYLDSVSLMSMSTKANAVEGVTQALLGMATPMNKEVLANVGVHDPAIDAARQTLTNGGLSCAGMQVSVDTASFHPGGDVTAHLSCSADLAGLTLSGVPGHIPLHSTATSPLEPYRQLTTASTP